MVYVASLHGVPNRATSGNREAQLTCRRIQCEDAVKPSGTVSANPAGRRRKQRGMKRFIRLALYAVPYWFQSLLGVVLLALVGLLDPLRIALVGPILNTVLNPAAKTSAISLLPNL